MRTRMYRKSRMKSGKVGLRSLLAFPFFTGAGLLDKNGWENTSSSPVNIADNEGLLVEVPAGELVYPGARYERNLVGTVIGTTTESFAGWSTFTNGSISGNELIISGDSGGAFLNDGASKTGNTQDISYSIELSGEEGKKITIALADAGTVKKSKQITLTAEPKWYAVTSQGSTYSSSVRLLIRWLTGGDSNDQTITLHRYQYHDVTGRTNQNPPEYLPVGTGDGVELSLAAFTAPGGGTVNTADGITTVTNGATGFDYALTSFTTVVGKQYIIERIVEGGTAASISFGVGTFGGDVSLGSNGTVGTVGDVVDIVFTAVGATTYARIGTNSPTDGITMLFSGLQVSGATDGFATYNRKNGNTVDGSGVVTEALGALLDPQPYLKHWPGSTNVNPGYNLSPTDLTGITTLSGSPSIVDDSSNYASALVARGSGNVLLLPAGAKIIINGNPDTAIGADVTFSAYARGGGFTLTIGGSNNPHAFPVSSEYVYIERNTQTGASNQSFVLNADSGADVYIIGWQPEPGSFATPLIETSGAPESRNATDYKLELVQDSKWDTGDGVDLITGDDATFDSDTGNWEKGTDWSIAGGLLQSSTTASLSFFPAGFSAGETYTASMDVDGTGVARIYIGSNNYTQITVSGPERITVTNIRGDNDRFYLYNLNGDTLTFDNISIQKVQRNFKQLRQDKGTLLSEFTPSSSATDLDSETMGMFAIRDSSASISYVENFGAPLLASTDGSVFSTGAFNWLADDRYLTVTRWSEELQELQNGHKDITLELPWVWGSVGVYTGAFPYDDYANLFYDAAYANTAHDVKVLPKALTVEQVEDKYTPKSSGNFDSLLTMPSFNSSGLLSDNDWENDCSSPVNTLDNEGLLVEVPASEIVYEGARYEQNLLSATEDLTDGVWVTVGSGISLSSNAIQMIVGESFSGLAQTVTDEPSGSAGTYLLVGDFWVDSGEGSIRLTITRTGHLDTDNGDTTLTTTPQRLSILVSYDAVGTVTKAYIRNGSDLLGRVVRCANLAFHNVTGRTNQNPPEYLPVGTGDGVDLVASDFTDAIWTEGTGWSTTSTTASCDGTQGATSYLTLAYDFITANSYAISFDYTNATGDPEVHQGTQWSSDLTGSGTYTGLISGYANSSIALIKTPAGATIEVSNISVQKSTDGYGVFNTENGNTVDGNGVVSSNVGALLSPAPFIKHVPAATNNVHYSQEFDNVYWSKTDATVSLNFPAPDGKLTARKITSTGASAHSAVLNVAFSGDIKSIYARTVSGSGTVNLLGHNSDTGNLRTITETWERFDVEYDNETASPTFKTHFYAVDFRGASTLTEVLVWGAQLEESSFATPLIETSGASESRNTTAYKQPLVQDAEWDAGDGTELWLTPNIDPAWTDNEDGSYDLVGNGSYQPMVETDNIVNGETYLVVFNCEEVSGNMKVQSAGSVFSFNSVGLYSEVITATANLLGFARNTGTVNCKLSGISIQKIKDAHNFTAFTQDEGLAIADFVPEYDINAANTNAGVFSIRDNAGGVLYHGFAGVLTYDGVNATSELTINSNGTDLYRAVVRWSTANSELQVGYKNLTTDSVWTWSAIVTYDGEFTAGDHINLFYGNNFLNQLHDIQTLKINLTTDQIEAKYGN